MMQLNMHEAKSQLSKLGDLAWQGETIVIAKAGKPYLDLIPHKTNKKRTPGNYKHCIQINDDFNDEDLEIIAAFEDDLLS
jgi:antitoxin (DNA-binding transcriptional repressor) of toxin-antitoxin stability system